jgi:hypothetical protein
LTSHIGTVDIPHEVPTTRIIKRATKPGVTRFGWGARFKISKVDDQGVVFGWASNAVTKAGDYIVDHDQDVIPAAELEQAVYAYVEKSRKATDRHKRRADADLIESVFLDAEKRAAMDIGGDDLSVAWWVGYRVRDPEVLGKVRSGEYKEFSIGGLADREPHPSIEDAFVLKNLEIDEVGFVDLGAGLGVEIALAKEKAMSMKDLVSKMLAFVPKEQRGSIEKKLSKIAKAASMEDIKSKLSAEEWELIQEHLAPPADEPDGDEGDDTGDDGDGPADAGDPAAADPAADPAAPPAVPPKKGAPMKNRKPTTPARDPEVVRLEKQAKDDRVKLDKALGEVADLQKQARFTKYLDEASKYTHAPANRANIAKMLLAADDNPDKELGKEQRELVVRSHAALKESKLFKTFGSTGGEGADGSAEDRLQVIAKGLREKDPKLTKEKAFLKAAEENPELYLELRDEGKRSAS